ncbi:hypothetical protein BDV96DRAFT_589318 [Lophiotrema nucula]|uniref:Myb-like domain-containing protein n=1 Tax=Lophiotrema nucula TaxID=690887 RepID=A0A6A5YMJ1_9PLEO|nr:hypothetical protein BDV96DRAFT_589318 [Lophiotrema nucula]
MEGKTTSDMSKLHPTFPPPHAPHGLENMTEEDSSAMGELHSAYIWTGSLADLEKEDISPTGEPHSALPALAPDSLQGVTEESSAMGEQHSAFVWTGSLADLAMEKISPKGKPHSAFPASPAPDAPLAYEDPSFPPPPSYDQADPAATLEEIMQQQRLHIHHIDKIQSLDFMPHRMRTDMFLNLNTVGWPKRLCSTTKDTSRGQARWHADDDNPLMLLHLYELAWKTIARVFFPDFTAEFLEERWRVADYRSRQEVIARFEARNSSGIPKSSSTPKTKDDARSVWPQPLRDRVFEAFQAGISIPDIRVTYCPERTEAALSNIVADERKKRGVEIPRRVHNKYKDWTDEEDTLLLSLRREGSTFEEVAARLPGRTRPGCNRRFNELVAKMSEGEESGARGLKTAKTVWTPEDDKLVLSERDSGGKSFEAIRHAHFPGRTLGGVKARYLRLKGKKGRKGVEEDSMILDV